MLLVSVPDLPAVEPDTSGLALSLGLLLGWTVLVFAVIVGARPAFRAFAERRWVGPVVGLVALVGVVVFLVLGQARLDAAAAASLFPGLMSALTWIPVVVGTLLGLMFSVMATRRY